MFLYESIPWYSTLMWVAVVAGLMLANEIARASKWAALVLFIGLPVLLTIFVWPHTAGADSSTGTWNIFEAVVRDFEVASMNGLIDGVMMVGGPWNIMNGIAGLLNLVTICGWAGIYITRDKNKDMIWPDMLWFWIIAYDLWNFAYVYNAVGDHSFYAGAALLISCTIPAFFIKRGAWLQHRAQTLAFWMMFTMAVPTFVTSSKFAVESSHNPTALFIVSAISLAANIAVVIYQVRVIVRTKRNPLKDELFVELPAYQKVLADNRPLDAARGTSAPAAPVGSRA